MDTTEGRVDRQRRAARAGCAAAERALLATLDGSCRTPIGGYAVIDGGKLHLKAQIAAEDGGALWTEIGDTLDVSLDGATALGNALGVKLRAQTPDDLYLEDYLH